MRILVYSRRNQFLVAMAVIEGLHAERYRAAWRDAREYGGEVEPCDKVITDLDPVRAAYEAKGVPVEPLTELPSAPDDIPGHEQAPAAGGGDPVSGEGGEGEKKSEQEPLGPQLVVDEAPPVVEQPADLSREGYRIETSGPEHMPWYKLIGPDGEQVGKAQRSEAEAWAQLEVK